MAIIPLVPSNLLGIIQLVSSEKRRFEESQNKCRVRKLLPCKFMRIRFVRKINDPSLSDDASLHVHFPETQLDVSRSIDTLFDSLEGREEYHVNEGRASDTDTKTCPFC